MKYVDPEPWKDFLILAIIALLLIVLGCTGVLNSFNGGIWQLKTQEYNRFSFIDTVDMGMGRSVSLNRGYIRVQRGRRIV